MTEARKQIAATRPRKAPRPSPLRERAPEVMRAVLDRLGFDRSDVEEVLGGCRVDALLTLEEAMAADRRTVAGYYRHHLVTLYKALHARGPEKCEACGAVIYFVPMPSGKEAPFTQDGLNHFGDCPQAERFRRKP